MCSALKRAFAIACMHKQARGGPHNHYANSLVGGAGCVVQGVGTGLQANRSTIALPFFLVLVHGVLKCAHHPVLKYVMLRHPAVSSQDFLHCSRLEAIVEDAFRGTSPAPWLHLTLGLAGPHPHLGGGGGPAVAHALSPEILYMQKNKKNRVCMDAN